MRPSGLKVQQVGSDIQLVVFCETGGADVSTRNRLFHTRATAEEEDGVIVGQLQSTG
jgi:hypothetical protein